jgi:ribonuclease Z
MRSENFSSTKEPARGHASVAHQSIQKRNSCHGRSASPALNTVVAVGMFVVSFCAGQVRAQPAPSSDQAITVTLLGTGTPVPLSDRFGPSTLVEAGGRKLLFDAGRGVPIRMSQLGLPLGVIDTVLLTHFHSDHLNGLPDVWMTSYIPVGFGNRTKPLRLVGPTGTAHIAEGMRATFSNDIETRMADEHVPEAATRIDVQEFSKDGVVLDEGGLRVTAFKVNHGELIHPSYGYRIDYAGHSVLISGDTKYEQNIIEHGRGIDLLIHEVCAVPEPLQNLPNIKQVINHHTSPQEAGRIFALTRPKMAAYTHLVLLGTREQPPLTVPDIERQTRETYDGPLTTGEDLTRFVISDRVTVQRWDPARNRY